MINNFTVKANDDNNELSVIMDGYFMKSELDLALYLVKSEIKKLTPGFTVKIDITHLCSSGANAQFDTSLINNLTGSLGAGKIKYTGYNTTPARFLKPAVGFYPYENEWFLC